VLSLFTVDGEEEGLAACKKILANEGLGHTAIIHTRSPKLVERFGSEILASRVLVNAGGSQGCIGIGNGLMPSLTLGCGTFGGTSTTDNVSYTHLLNIKRVVHPLSAPAPAS
jgi:acyl-CoA reductase-like NAD-dependent aldehyde dehydrogenase